ncbi:DnaJ homolog subfamily C member 11 [Strongyloides ratti]|uniref:DnaJ homolog subfamily C member 11 n=1 Tax=Strongyloides ratti TaxID=34506 RepID=A0A090LJ79_STRRB|nr:DnaJ homolog subfamily C member 11 [Strongyloides ratti]CEF67595.1 DnaJ homolog subfamily C member 11 [Strongyloides ratti]
MNSDDSFSSIYGSDFEDSESKLNGDENELDYYAILNVPRDANAEDISKAYKHRCRIFHPDRHNNVDDKNEAEKIFVQLRNAYTTLIDPKKRAIYDAVGVKGLDFRGWEIVERSNVSDDIKRQFEFLKKFREQEFMLSKVHPSGRFLIRGDCSGLFKRYKEERFPPTFSGMSIAQSVDYSVTMNDRIFAQGKVSAFNGRGSGNFQITWKNLYSQMVYFENALTFNEDDINYDFKIIGSVSPKVAVAIQPSILYLPMHGIYTPRLSLVYRKQLHPEIQGSITYSVGKNISSLTTSMEILEFNLPKFLLNLTLSPLNSFARIAYFKRYAQNDSFYAAECTFSFSGCSPSLNFKRKLGKFSKIGCGINFSFPSCLLIVNFKIETSLLRYQTQLVLCDNEEDVGRAFIYGTILPYIGFNILRMIFHKPIEKFMRIFRDDTIDTQVNLSRKEEAMKICHLMRETAERITNDEDRKHGLIILEAKYGEMIDSGPSSSQYPVAGNNLIDVTVQLQAMVNDSQLRIYSSKSQLPGFYDPCPGKPKMLRISYRFRDEIHLCTVADEFPLNIPLSVHRV